MCNQLNIQSSKERVVRTAWALLLFCPPFVKGISLSPCGGDNVQEVLADQETHFICTAERPIQWKLLLNKTASAIFLAECNKDCVELDGLEGLFMSRAIDAHKSAMIIKPASKPLLYNNVQYLNGSLECSLRDVDNMSARCGLNYVDPPKNVSCTASNVSWSVNVSCTIGSVFSSRKSYSCQLILSQDLSNNETLRNVTMLTSLTSKDITNNELKVSGSCQFNTTLPSEEGLYGFYVSVSPGGQHFSASDKRFSVERPTSPTISCSPQPYVLANTNVTCTCRTSSLGQPTGYMRWITGNQSNHEKYVKEGLQSVTPQELIYTQSLTLSDHGTTWFRCDIVWGTKTIRGENYTAHVGYAAKIPQLSGREEGETVMEGDEVHLRCESEGRPTPTVFIYNNDNETFIRNNSSPVINTFIARCEDSATYTCSAWNEFSNESDSVNSHNLSLHIGCKPRSNSATDIAKITFRNKTEELMFDIISYPEPHKYHVWFLGPTLNSSKSSFEKDTDSVINVTCNAQTSRKYLAKCKLTIFSIPPESGFYKVLVINKHGNETFTVEIIHSATDPTRENTTSQPAQSIITIAAGVSAGFFFVATVIAITVLTLRKKRSKDGWGTSGLRNHLIWLAKIPPHFDQRLQLAHGNYIGAIETAKVTSRFKHLKMYMKFHGIVYSWLSLRPSNTPHIDMLLYQLPLTMQPSRVNITAGTSQPATCQTPVYAVVDKTKKKTNTRPVPFAGAADDREEARRDIAQGSKASNLGFCQDTDTEYAVLDKSRGRAPARRDKDYNNKNNKPSQNTRKGFVNEKADNNVYDHLVMQQLPAQRDVAVRLGPSGSASHFHSEDDGKWVNDDGLIYVTPFFDVAAGVKRRPPPSQEETEYCSLQTISLKKN